MAIPLRFLPPLVALACLASGCATMLVTGGLEPDRTAPTAAEAALAARVVEALDGRTELDATRIAVSADGYVVTLSGSVATAAQRDRAASVAAGVAGVARIINRLAVSDDS